MIAINTLYKNKYDSEVQSWLFDINKMYDVNEI